MKKTKYKINNRSIIQSTCFAKEIAQDLISKVDNFQNDNEKFKRKESCLCKTCYYINNSRIGGASITTIVCGICEDVMTFSSTSIDKICKPCARLNRLCVQCSGDIGMKNSKILRPNIGEL